MLVFQYLYAPICNLNDFAQQPLLFPFSQVNNVENIENAALDLETKTIVTDALSAEYLVHFSMIVLMSKSNTLLRMKKVYELSSTLSGPLNHWRKRSPT
jgi:hypothetical protein